MKHRWIFIVLILVVGVSVILTFGYLFYTHQKDNMEAETIKHIEEYAKGKGYITRIDYLQERSLFRTKIKCLVINFQTDDKMEYWIRLNGRNIFLYSIRCELYNSDDDFYINPGSFLMDILGDNQLYVKLKCYAKVDYSDKPVNRSAWLECDNTFSLERVKKQDLGKHTKHYYDIMLWLSQDDLIKMYQDGIDFETQLKEYVYGLNNE